MSCAPISRFAPSPTGALHLGHAYSAVQAWHLTRAGGAGLRLRIDDLDHTRARTSYRVAAQADLAWLGITFTGAVVKQSERGALYRRAVEHLRGLGLLYPCFCSRADIAAMVTAPHTALGAVYPGQCRNLSVPVRTARMVRENYCWRLDMAAALDYVAVHVGARKGAETRVSRLAESLRWYDEKRGWRIADPMAYGDIVMARKDALASYHLASTLDDAAMGISLVVRGADLLEATDIHIILQRLLHLPQPRYHHHALVCDSTGRRLAKRDAVVQLDHVRSCYEGAQLAAMLAEDILPSGYSFADM